MGDGKTHAGVNTEVMAIIMSSVNENHLCNEPLLWTYVWRSDKVYFASRLGNKIYNNSEVIQSSYEVCGLLLVFIGFFLYCSEWNVNQEETSCLFRETVIAKIWRFTLLAVDLVV